MAEKKRKSGVAKKESKKNALDQLNEMNGYGTLNMDDVKGIEEVEDLNSESYEELEAVVLKNFNDRFNSMKGERSEFDNDWLICDAQIEARSEYDAFGRLQVNIPLESSLCEIAEGRESGKLTFTVEPLDQPDANETVVAKQALMYHLERGSFYEERNKIRRDRRIYGLGVAYTGITYERTVSYDVEGEVDATTPLYDNSSYKQSYKDNYILTGKHVPIRHFWMDERAIWTGDFKNANDCIMQETISHEEFVIRRGDNPFFKHIDELIPASNDMDPSYARSTARPSGQHVILYYFNKITQDYWIMADYKTIIFIGKMLYKHGELPFKIGQYYPRHNCIYGQGIPGRIRYLKVYKTQTRQNMLDNSQISGAPIVLAGNDAFVDGQAGLSPNEINVLQTSSGLDQVKITSIPNNIQAYQYLMDQIDDQVVQDSGENLRAPYQAPADQLGTVEIIENNRLTRVKPMDEADDFLMGGILTHTMDNITQFFRDLYSQETKTKEGDVPVKSDPMITIKDATVKQEGNKIIIKEDKGKFGFFSFKKEMIKNRFLIRIVHSSNTNVMKVLDKNSITQYIQNKVSLFQIDPTLVKPQDMERWSKYLDLVYGYDEMMLPESKKDEIKAKNVEMMNKIMGQLGMSPQGQMQGNMAGQLLGANQPMNGAQEQMGAVQDPMAELAGQSPGMEMV